jgi:lysyl-tRNA synthetase class 2
MTLKVLPVKRPSWTPLTQEGCVNVFVKSLLSLDHLALAMLRFEKEATIHEHPADFDVDVICLGGSGFTSVGKEQSPIYEGERVRWPAGQPHRLWTTDDEMLTLMVEHTKSAEPVWENVDSSMISAFKYDPAKKELEVMFTRTGTYRYFDVPEDVIKDLREADSKGSFMRYAVIDMFEYEKVGR